MSKIKIFLTFLLINCQALSFANEVTYDHEYLENLALSTVLASLPSDDEQQVEASVMPLDPRIVINPCDNQLAANIPENHNSRNVNVKITCEGSIPWNIYIPVKITVTQAVLVAKHVIDKGSILTEENVEVAQLPVLKIRGEVLNSLDSVIGAKAKRNISMGRAISKKHICTVCKGDNVTLIASSSLLQIKTEGTSISSGHIGDKVRVRNDRSGKLVTGKVTGVNKVTIIL